MSDIHILQLNGQNDSNSSFDQFFERPNLRRDPSLISNRRAIRLYETVKRSASTTILKSSSIPDIFSEDDLNQEVCRICRYKSISLELIPTPCKCTGTVGFIHLKCLHRWIRLRGSRHCEICRELYNPPPEKRDYTLLILNFFYKRYFTSLLRKVSNLMSATTLVYLTSNQLMDTMDLESDRSTFKMMFLGPSLFLATTMYFFLYFDWAINTMFNIKHIFLHWWNFGDQDDNNQFDDLSANSFDFSDLFNLGI